MLELLAASHGARLSLADGQDPNQNQAGHGHHVGEHQDHQISKSSTTIVKHLHWRVWLDYFFIVLMIFGGAFGSAAHDGATGWIWWPRRPRRPRWPRPQRRNVQLIDQRMLCLKSLLSGNGGRNGGGSGKIVEMVQ